MSDPLILDRYRPLSTSGTGGSGTVQICWDTRIQRRVAIKRIAVPTAQQDGQIPGLAEARTGAMLRHPNIVSVIDFEAKGQEAFLIMEAVEGASLSSIIDNAHRGELDLDVVAAVLDAVGSAMDFAHDNGVLHLDIKPDNILIDMNGNVKVADFGVAELAGIDGFGQAAGGTIGYMPPEQARGDDLDQRTDAFALGVVVYEMLTGRNPYNARSIKDSLKLMEQGEVPPVSEHRVDTGQELDLAMDSAIDSEPSQRYETVLELVDALLPLLGEPSAGKEKLRAIIEGGEEEDEGLCRSGDVWANVSPRARSLASRLCCAALSWWLAAVGLVAMDILKTEYAVLLALSAGILGAVFPGLGALCGMAFLAAGIIANPALPLPLGILLALLACAWWVTAGRERIAAANTTLATAPLMLAWATPLAPMLTGFTLRPLQALPCAVMQAVLAVTLAALTGGDLLHAGLVFTSQQAAEQLMGLLQTPVTWICLFSWIFVAVCVSALCSRQSRVLSIVSAVLAGAVLIGADALMGYTLTGNWQLASQSWAVSGICCAAIMVVIGALGAPYRFKKED